MRTKNKRTIERTQEQTNDKMKRTITRNIRTKAYLEETCLKEQTNVRMNGKQRNLLPTDTEGLDAGIPLWPCDSG